MRLKKNILGIVVFLTVVFLSLRYAGSTANIVRPFFGYLFFTFCLSLLYIKNLGKVKGTDVSLYIFIFYMIITVSWSGSTSYGLTKPIMLILFTLFFVIGQKYIVLNFKQIAYSFLISNVLFIILFYITFGNPFEVVVNALSRLKDDETNPITFSRYLGFASFFVIYLFFTHKNIFLKGAFTVLFFVSMIYMVLSGSKGPVFAFIIAAVILSLLLNKKLITKIGYVIAIAGALIYGLNKLLTSELSTFIEDRYTANEHSYDARTDFMTNSLELVENTHFFNFIFGSGSGDYAIFKTGVDTRSYPHNLIVEILFEYGVLGLALFLIFIYYSLKGWRKSIHDRVYSYLLALWVYTGLNSMVSGDIYGNFLFFGMCILLYARRSYIKYDQINLKATLN